MSTKEKNNIKLKKAFGHSIKSIREAKGLSQMDLASLSNLEKTSISRIENGRTNVTLTTIAILSTALEVKLSTIFDFERYTK